MLKNLTKFKIAVQSSLCNTWGLHCTFLVDPGFGGILCQKEVDSVVWKFSFDCKARARNEIKVGYTVHACYSRWLHHTSFYIHEVVIYGTDTLLYRLSSNILNGLLT